MVVKKKRVEVTTTGKKMREEATAYNKAVLTEEKRILGLLAPIETHLDTEENKITEEKERIKGLEVAAKEAITQARANRLLELGCNFDRIVFSYKTFSIPESIMATMEDEGFEIIYREVAAMVREEEERQAAEKEAQDAEKKRMAQEKHEQEKEKKRLEEEKILLANAKAKVEADQEAERKRLADEKASLEVEKRALQKAKG